MSEIFKYKYSRIWRLLSRHTFVPVGVPNCDLVCVICGGILKNAHQSVCGCRYCYECIVSFVNNDNKHCPGPGCGSLIIGAALDLQIDHLVNRKVSEMIVMCPIDGCDHQAELKTMETHIKTHSEVMVIDLVTNESGTEDRGDCCNLQENGGKMTDDVAILHSRIGQLKNELKEKDNRLEMMEKSFTQMSESQKLAINLLNQKLSEYSTTNVKLVKDIKVVENKLNEELTKNQSIVKKFQRSIELLKTKFNGKTEEIDQRLNKLDESQLIADRKQESLDQDIERVSHQTDLHRLEFEKHQMKLGLELDKMYNNLTQSGSLEFGQVTNFSPFQWRISRFMDKYNRAKSGVPHIFSEPFYSHPGGYKIRLKIYPYGDEFSRGRFLSVFFCIIKGEYDENLTWPMNRDVVLHLVDQVSDVSYLHEQFNYETCALNEKCVFYRPNDINDGIGASQFIKFTFLFNHCRIFRDDSVVVRCTADPL